MIRRSPFNDAVMYCLSESVSRCTNDSLFIIQYHRTIHCCACTATKIPYSTLNKGTVVKSCRGIDRRYTGSATRVMPQTASGPSREPHRSKRNRKGRRPKGKRGASKDLSAEGERAKENEGLGAKGWTRQRSKRRRKGIKKEKGRLNKRTGGEEGERTKNAKHLSGEKLATPLYFHFFTRTMADPAVMGPCDPVTRTLSLTPCSS